MASNEITRLDLGVFRYTNLPTELQEMILEEAIITTQKAQENLSHLASVSRKWQDRIEQITFASLTEFDTAKDPVRAPGPAIQLRDFERIVVGKRRLYLKKLTIDFNLDADGMPEHVQAASLDDDALGHAVSIRRCHRFTDYTRDFFRIMLSWDPELARPSYLSVRIRVCGFLKKVYIEEALRMREDFTGLPHIGVVRNFELIYDYCGYSSTFPKRPTYFVPPGSVIEILDRLPLLDKVRMSVNLQVPAFSDLLRAMGQDGFVDIARLSRDALLDLPRASHIKRIVLLDHGKVGDFCEFFVSSGDQPCIEAICTMGRRLQTMRLSRVVKIYSFLEHAVASEPSSPWLHMENLVLADGIPYTVSQIRCITDWLGDLVARMPALEMIEIMLYVNRGFDMMWYLTHKRDPWPSEDIFRLRVQYIRTANRDDHMLMTIDGPFVLTMRGIKHWERSVGKSRGVPLRIAEPLDESEAEEETMDESEAKEETTNSEP